MPNITLRGGPCDGRVLAIQEPGNDVYIPSLKKRPLTVWDEHTVPETTIDFEHLVYHRTDATHYDFVEPYMLVVGTKWRKHTA